MLLRPFFTATSLLALSLFAQCAFATDMRFRPDLEVPSQYPLSAKSLKSNELKYHDLINSLTASFPAIYTSLEAGDFKADDLITPIRNALIKEIDQCIQQQEAGGNQAEYCVQQTVKPVILSLRAKNFYDDLVTEYLLDAKLYMTSAPEDAFIQNYWDTLKFIQKTKNINANHLENPYQKYGRFRRDYGQFEDLTPRQFLFKKYSFTQIIKMSKLIELILKIQNSAKGSIDIDFEGDGTDDYKHPLGIEERFRFAEIEFTNLIEKYNGDDSFLKKTGFNKTDVMAAGLETGIIAMPTLQNISKVIEMNDPRSQFWHTFLGVAKTVGSTVLLVNPATALYATTGLIFLSTLEEVKNAKKRRDSTIVF